MHHSNFVEYHNKNHCRVLLGWKTNQRTSCSVQLRRGSFLTFQSGWLNCMLRDTLIWYETFLVQDQHFGVWSPWYLLMELSSLSSETNSTGCFSWLALRDLNLLSMHLCWDGWMRFSLWQSLKRTFSLSRERPRSALFGNMRINHCTGCINKSILPDDLRQNNPVTYLCRNLNLQLFLEFLTYCQLNL